jgi:glycosyltransferase involved in cell wall biosynthesis
VLNVLQLIPTLDRSGAEKQMVLLATGLPRDRFRVEVAALTRLGPLEGELRDAHVPVTLIGKRLKVDPLALGRLVRLMRSKRFDVVQTWIFAANVYGRVAAHRARVPVVVTAEMAVDLWKGKAQLAVDRRLAAWTDKVVGNSDAVVDFYRKAGVPDDRLAMIPSGIADEEPPDVDPSAVRADFGFPSDSKLAIFVGRLAPQKAVDDLLSALDLLQHTEPNLRTLIVGDGPLREQLQARAHAFTLDEAVKFLGHRDDVPRLLAASDLLVLPSLYEGLPNVVLEAMRFRKPVVATAAPGTTEVVADGETGRLVPLRDFVALARAIRELIRDPVKARQMGEAGRVRVESEFRAATMVERFAALYEGLARAKGLAVG